MTDGRDSKQTATQRRTILKACCAFALAAPTVAARADETDEAGAPPQIGDALVFAFGKRAGHVIASADLSIGSKQVLAFPMNPATQRVRDASRLNQLVVVRLDPAHLMGDTIARGWRRRRILGRVLAHRLRRHRLVSDKLQFKCPCHESEFDPSDAARVVGGPAPWQLAALPLKLAGDAIVVAGPFVGRLGFAQPAGGPSGP